MLTFYVYPSGRGVRRQFKPNSWALVHSSWNDFTFRTLFNLSYVDKDGRLFEIGHIKIGFEGQDVNVSTYDRIDKEFTSLPKNFFSLAESPEFYDTLYNLAGDDCEEVLSFLNCVVVSEDAMNAAKNQEVFLVSLMRDLSMNTVRNQFPRIINGLGMLEEFDFSFLRRDHKFSDLKLTFTVDPFVLPPSNIHAIIGRNGLGKTTLLNQMIKSLVNETLDRPYGFYNAWGNSIGAEYFSTVVSVSFSAFDPFRPLSEQDDPLAGVQYYYIGLKSPDLMVDFESTVPLSTLRATYAESVKRCCSDISKRNLWLKAIRDLESDANFKDLNLTELAGLDSDEIEYECIKLMNKMSSGHTVVFMTISRLVEKLQEKTLILLDEPESHLHPPLLSAFIRSLSNLLHSRNGVAIVATHSPVVVQEIPRKCCWVLKRSGEETSFRRPSIETFAENVGEITKDVFNLEMERSGFHKLFKDKVDAGYSFEAIVKMFEGNIGLEGKSILMSMVMIRDSSNN